MTLPNIIHYKKERKDEEPSQNQEEGNANSSKFSKNKDKEPTSVRSGKPLKWKLGEVIGKGGFGSVHQAINEKNGGLFAVKTMTKSNVANSDFDREVRALYKLKHPNIVNIFGIEEKDDNMYILMELVSGKSLHDIIKNFGRLSEDVIRNYTRQIVEGLSFCHKKNIIHRDIKGKNILVNDKGVVKLADFGSAKESIDASINVCPSENMAYTPLWVAPELVRENYSKAVDIWSLGCVLIEMSSGREPWAEKNFKNNYNALFFIASSNEIPQIPDHLSSECKDFIKSCLTRDKNKRPKASDLLQHPFLQIKEED